MKRISVILTAICSLFFGKSLAQERLVTPPASFYELSFTTISGDSVDFISFKDKKVLLVNTASKCGFTPQFKDLEELYQQYKDKLVIIGFPSNDFGSQDPGTNTEIQEFCQLNYGVTFLMMEKSSVKGDDKNLVFQWLTDKAKNGWNTAEPSWNFCKYLVDEEGRLIGFFPSKVKPVSTEITGKI